MNQESQRSIASFTDDTDVVNDRFAYDNAIVRRFLIAMYGWAIVTFLIAIVTGTLLLFSSVTFDIPQLSFGRLQPLYNNVAVLAFAGNAIFAAIYYSTQRLCKARMWSDSFSALHFWSWQLIILSAVVTLPLGITQGREYAELEWPIDLAIAVVWIGFFGVNFFMTLINRRERHMYASLWFYIATIVAFAYFHIINNLVIPAGLIKSDSIYSGAQDALMQWSYGRGGAAFFLAMPFLGLMYYFLPKAADRPVFSYRLTIIHFWSLLIISILAGAQHLHYSPLPDWASTLGMVFGIMLWMPGSAGVINGLLTLRGVWQKSAADPVIRFLGVAIAFYALSTFESALFSIKSINALSNYTDLTIAHADIGLLGWNGFLAFGMMYWLLPRIFQTKLYSARLAMIHFWIALFGVLLCIAPSYVAGIMQIQSWLAMTSDGQLQNPTWMPTVQAVQPMHLLRIVGGSLYLIAALIGGYNFFLTWMSRPAVYENPMQESPRLSPNWDGDQIPPPATIDNVLDLAKKMEIVGSMWWHRRWEALPMTFSALTIAAVVIPSLITLAPMLATKDQAQSNANITPYTPLELAGRDIYIAEGCASCHTQTIRPLLAEVKRFDEYSKAAEFVYDHPSQWGSRRIGPDLAREGGKQSDYWHLLHFRNPSELSQGSIMPKYAYLERTDLDFAAIPERVKAMQTLGVPYSNDQYENAEALARAQAKVIAENIVTQSQNIDLRSLDQTRAIAIIAYLQRIGTDLKKTAVPATPATAPTTAPSSGDTKTEVR